jgi:hypothetical protein
MGFRVERLGGPAVCLRGNRVWVVAKEVLAHKPAERASYLEDEVGVERSVLKKIATEVKAAHTEGEMVAALEAQQAGRAGRAGKGRLVVQPGPERRRTSSHYTPRELTERVVTRALEPLLGAMGGTPSSERLLNLKICDPAMGSGAFLVAACRFLAEQVVAAWTREGKQAEVGSAREDALLRAKRLVAQRCLYGVDKNPLAVNLAKMSLWLETMARGEPFTFVDHALRHGDSLVGLSLDQIRAFDWDVKGRKQLELPFRAEIDEALTDALHRRQRILELAHQPDIPSGEKVALLRDAEDALERPRLIGDLLLGAWFSAEKDKEREAERIRRRNRLVAWLAEGGEVPSDLQTLVDAQAARVRPFHWMVEFPEIFCAEREDPLDADQRNQVAWMDGFVGNPPYSGKNGIAKIDRMYLPWLQHLHAGAHGNADLVAHFLRRANNLLGEHGTAGFVARKTIAEGDTRQAGLQSIVLDGAIIYDAISSMPWPGEAAVFIALVHTAKGSLHLIPGLHRMLDGQKVGHINSRLLAGVERNDPAKLSENFDLLFMGVTVLGDGFFLNELERSDLVRTESTNKQRIARFINGEELNASPDEITPRYVINFGDMSRDEANQWPALLARLDLLVRHERQKQSRSAYRRCWWLYAERRVGLAKALKNLKECIVLAQTSKYLCFNFQSANQIYSAKVFVVCSESTGIFAVLSSRLHEAWTSVVGSTMEERFSYTSACFATYPFPERKSLENGTNVAQAGRRLYDTRAKFMVDRNQGLTATYNQLKDSGNRDPLIIALRRLHEDMDRAVLSAYGWSAIEVPPFETPITADEKAAFERFSDAVIDRLFALNTKRAAAEGLMPPTSSMPDAVRRGPRRAAAPTRGREGVGDRAPTGRPARKRRKAS